MAEDAFSASQYGGFQPFFLFNHINLSETIKDVTLDFKKLGYTFFTIF